MNESAVYSLADVQPFAKRLEELHKIIHHDAESGKQSKAITTLLDRQINECSAYLCSYFCMANVTIADAIVHDMQESLSVLSPELAPIHQKLVKIRRMLVTLAAKEGSHKAELKPLQEELRKIDSLSILSRLVMTSHHSSPCLFVFVGLPFNFGGYAFWPIFESPHSISSPFPPLSPPKCLLATTALESTANS